MQECMNCALIDRCRLVNEQKLMNYFVCNKWEEARPETIDARVTVIEKFGRAAIRVLVPQRPHDEEE